MLLLHRYRHSMLPCLELLSAKAHVKGTEHRSETAVSTRHHHADFDLSKDFELSRHLTSNGHEPLRSSRRAYDGRDRRRSFLSVQRSFLGGRLLATSTRSWAASAHERLVYHWRYRRSALSAARIQFRRWGGYDACPADLSFASRATALPCDRQYEDMPPSHLSPVRLFMLAAGHDAFHEVLPELLHCESTGVSSVPATRAIFVVAVA